MLQVLEHIVQGLIGAMLVMAMRNDTVESFRLFGKQLNFGRSFWCGLTVLFASMFMAVHLPTDTDLWLGILTVVASTGIFALVLTAPHGQTLDGPKQIIPANEDDPYLEVAGWLCMDPPWAYEVLGWPRWIAYNMLRYVLPCALLGIMLESWLVGFSGLLTVLFYWPIAYMPFFAKRWDTRFFSAWTCGFWMFIGL